MEVEHYLTFAATCIGITTLGLFGVIKTCDWLIGLKYKTKDACVGSCADLKREIETECASESDVQHIKEDLADIKHKNDMQIEQNQRQLEQNSAILRYLGRMEKKFND